MTRSSDSSVAIVWFDTDLRLADNPSLDAAVSQGARVLPVYILDDESPEREALGDASRWWLHNSLSALSQALDDRGAPLYLRRGAADRVLPEIARAAGAASVHWGRRYEPWARAREDRVAEALAALDIAFERHNAALLHEPWTVRTGNGGSYGVFTPFWKAECALGDPSKPTAAPDRLTPAPRDGLDTSERLADWALLPMSPDWAGGLRAAWSPGEAGAAARLDAFLDSAVAHYPDRRNRPDLDATSHLSPHLHFGELSARQVWHAARSRAHAAGGGAVEKGVWAFLRELSWRDFNHNLLYHTPAMVSENYQGKFDRFPWHGDEEAFAAWTAGRTGYPVVDAGMRELWSTGFMHNRIRMVTASFLVKHLLVPWQWGEAWFRDTLVDADLANNVANWQWVAGCGADAAPYFRIFNPMTQGEKFDPEGAYVRRWVPELADLPTRFLHAPWTADPVTLEAAGVRLGSSYPEPIVDHKQARARALEAYEAVKGAA